MTTPEFDPVSSEDAAPAPAIVKRRSHRQRRAVIVAALVCVVIGVVFVHFIHPQPISPPHPLHTHPAQAPQTVFTSLGPDQAVHVPFTLRQGMIYVNANLNGRMAQCMVDTGTTAVVIPGNLGINGRTTGVATRAANLWGLVLPGKQIIVPSISLGSFEIQNTPAVLEHTPFSQGIEPPTLGNNVFSQKVLTIDYVRRELVLHPCSYDFTADRSIHNGYILDLIKSNVYGDIPCVRGFVDGVRGFLMFDTGLGGNGILVDPTILRDTHPYGYAHAVEAPKLRLPVLEKVICLMPSHGASRTASSFSFQAPAAVLPHPIDYPLTPNPEADIGYAVLSLCRLTIDYQRRRMLVQVNPT